MSSIRLRNLSVEFPVYHGGGRSLKKTLLSATTGGSIVRAPNRTVVRALSDVSVDIDHGDRVALIGPNGAGKTTLLRVMAGTYEPVIGSLEIDGHVAPLFDAGVGLNHDATGYENITFRGLYMGMRPREIARHIDDIAEFTELGEYLAVPIRTYSSGMLLRLAFAVATCVEPEILLMDEWLLAGDAHFLNKARNRLLSFIDRSSIMVLASHSDGLLREWCSKALYLERGQVKAFGPIDEVLAQYAGSVAAG